MNIFYKSNLGFIINNISIVNHRLSNLGINPRRFKSPADTVKWLGAVQAQDYYGSLWGVGLRTKGSTIDSIESAISDRKIVRSWPMRHTLHLTAHDDLRWMLKWLTPKIINLYSRRRRELELDDNVLRKSRNLFVKALQGGNQITRNNLYKLLDENGISSSGQRGIHILAHLSMEGLLCFGPRHGKQFTFTLLDEWIPESKILSREEALGELAKRYFISHGPAAVQDFAWWTGLTLTDARNAAASVKDYLKELIIENKSYLYSRNSRKLKSANSAAIVLPAFDEYFVGYKDRSAALESGTPEEFTAPFSLLSPVILINGCAAGTWGRRIIKNKVIVDIKPFRKYSKEELDNVHESIAEYCRFIQMPPGDVRVRK